MSFIFNEFLYRPLYNVLILIYNFIPGHDFGVAIIVLTIFIRLILMPLSIKGLTSQKNIARIQPKLKEVQEKHKNDKEALSRETMALYREHKVNPLSGCLPLLIQIPILFALYKAFTTGLKPESLTFLYGFVKNPGVINHLAFNIFDLTKRSPVMAILAGALQWVQSKKMNLQQTSGQEGQNATMASMNKQMLYFFPAFIIIIAWNLPLGLTLYWVVTTLFSIFEQTVINRKFNKGEAAK